MVLALSRVIIEPMRREDIESICAVERRCYPVVWHAGAYETELANSCARYYVARLEGQVVGYAGMWVIMDEAHITTLAVSPEQQGRKIGQRLLITLIEEAISCGAEYVTLEVRVSNAAARHMYRKYGFEERAIRKNYYTDNWEDAIVMWLSHLRGTRYLQMLGELKSQLPAIFDVRSGR